MRNLIINNIFNHFANVSCYQSFFGLEPWWRFLPKTAFNGCNIKTFNILSNGSSQPSYIPLVLLAVVDDLLRIAGLVAVFYVIYAAVQYVASQGNPEQTSKAMSTIINALIGLAIALIAIAIVSFLGSQLG